MFNVADGFDYFGYRVADADGFFEASVYDEVDVFIYS